MYASFRSVTAKKRQNINPHPDGKFFVDLIGLGILRDDTATEMLLLLMLSSKDIKGTIEVTYACMAHFQMVLQKVTSFLSLVCVRILDVYLAYLITWIRRKAKQSCFA